MDYGNLLSRAWDIIWQHKFLILLGVLVALTSTGRNGMTSSTNWARTDRGPEGMPPGWEDVPGMPEWPRNWAAGVGIVVAVILGLIALAIALIVWAVSTIARGGLIAGASTVDAGGASSFGDAFRAGWQRGWTLLGIGILPAIPGFLLLLLGAVALIPYTVTTSAGPGMMPRTMGALGVVGVVLAGLACFLLLLALVLAALSTFAYQAAMQEKMGVIDAYRRGTSVLLDNIGSALLLFLIQVAASIVIGLLLFIPGIIIALCCILWPLLILIQGAIAAYFTTMWTLAWRRWTGAVPADTV